MKGISHEPHWKVRGAGGPLLVALLLWSADGHAQRDPGAPSAEPVRGFASVDIGGRSLRYKCMGDGTPTVIIEPAAVLRWKR